MSIQPFFVDYLERLQSLHQEILEALQDLPQEALDWVPGPELNPLGVLVVHLTGAERYWIGDVVAREPSGRVREAEFQVQGLDVAALQGRLADTLAYARRVLENLTFQDLETARHAPIWGDEVSAGWALAHALEHTALHTGQIQITRQLWDQQHAREE
jgi:uncharacterized damage-inducible protein DinB